MEDLEEETKSEKEADGKHLQKWLKKCLQKLLKKRLQKWFKMRPNSSQPFGI